MTSRNKGQVKIGQSGSVIIGKEKRESSTKAKIGKSGPIIIGGGEDNRKSLKKEKQTIVKKERRSKKEKLEIISEGEDSDEENPIIIKFAKKINEFNVLVQDNKSSGRSWYHGLEGNWWWGMTEEGVRIKIESEQAIEDQKLEIESEQALEITPIPELQIRTVSEMIDQMTVQYDRDLPKDVEKRISYIYPLKSTHSFHIVAVNHIKHLKDKYLNDDQHIKIEEIDWSELSNIDWYEKRNVLIHPFLYPFASAESFIQNSKNFARLLAMKNKIGGFDVADSDRISKSAADLINKIDLMMVPSNFVKDTYVKSGVTIPIEVLPHGVSDEFLSDEISETENKKLIKLRKLKKKGKILILYFLIHSAHRKGADIVKKVMKRIQKKFKDVYLVVRSRNGSYFSEINSVCVDSWLSDEDLVALYDSCDVCISPSRGGGFELNALEAVSRGIPTLVPNGGCFTDLIEYYIPVRVSDKVVQPLPGNPIHIGTGVETDIDDFENKLIDVIERLDYWKDIFHKRTEEIRDTYSWRQTTQILDKILRTHRFIE